MHMISRRDFIFRQREEEELYWNIFLSLKRYRKAADSPFSALGFRLF
jgi:hypothetical protein